MLSHSSAIDKRRLMHRRQNSTPAIFDAAQIRPPPIAVQRRMGHRRGMSYDTNANNIGPMSPGIMSPGLINVSIPETIEQQPPGPGQQQQSQHSMQEAQQQSNAQPGSQFPLTPSRQRFHQPTPHQTPQNNNQPSAQQIKELEEHIKRVYGVNGNVYVSILPTPVSTPEKPAPLPMPENLDLTPMPTSLGNMADLSLDPRAADLPLFDSDPVEIPDSDGYESSYYSSEAMSPGGRSPTCSPQQKSIATFLEQVRNPPRLGFPFTPSSSFPLGSRPVNNIDPFFSQPSAPESPRSKQLNELQINGSVLDTGFSEEDIGKYMSEQDTQTGKWTCMFEKCGKCFGRKENIRSHIQTHLGDRQYKCNFCDKCFVRSHDLKRHVLIHSDEKPYACQCGSRFARQDALTRHRQRGMCEGGIHNPNRGSARRGRPRKERPDMQKRVDKASRTRKALAVKTATDSSIASQSSPIVAGSATQSWMSSDFGDLTENDLASSPGPSQHTMIDETVIVDNIYQQLAASAFNNSSNTPPMSATDSPSPLSMSSPDFSSEPDSSFGKSFFETSVAFDTPSKLDELFTGFDPQQEADWVGDMINGNSVF